jgi:hypothetical protein
MRKVVVLVILIGGIASACSRDSNQLTQQALYDQALTFVPKDASNVTTEPGAPWAQVAFDVRRGPLEFAIAARRLDLARAEGWTVCGPRTAAWTAYYDATTSPPRYVQHRAHVLYKSGVLIELVGLYYSPNEAEAVTARTPAATTPVQHGKVMARNATDKDVKEAANVFDLSCP